MLTHPISPQRLKTISRRHTQITQFCRDVDLDKFAKCRRLNIRGQLAGPVATEYHARFIIGKINDHAIIIPCRVHLWQALLTTWFLNLTRPIYSQTAKNGHFGHPEFGWEKTDLAHKLA